MPRRKSDPNAPKKPMTGYFTFCAEHRDRIKEEMRLSGGKVAPKLAELWKQLTEEKREEYKNNYHKAMEKYKDDLEAYKQTEEFQQYQNAAEEDGDEFIPESEEEVDEEEYNYEEIGEEEEEEEDEFESSEEEEAPEWEELERMTRREEAAERARKREERKRALEAESSGMYAGGAVQHYREEQWKISHEEQLVRPEEQLVRPEEQLVQDQYHHLNKRRRIS